MGDSGIDELLADGYMEWLMNCANRDDVIHFLLARDSIAQPPLHIHHSTSNPWLDHNFLPTDAGVNFFDPLHNFFQTT